MKRFLFISYYYPPLPSIASMRSWKLAKYIREFGWEPVVLASACDSSASNTSLPDVKVYRLENRLFLERITKNAKQKLLEGKKSVNPLCAHSLAEKAYDLARLFKRGLREAFAYPDDFASWHEKILIEGRRILHREKIHAILSSAGPFSSHVAASILSKETGIPWIADYRDLWTLNHHYQYSSLRRFFERRLETSVLQSASAIITVSEPLASMQSALLQKPVQTITNGFDPEDYSFSVTTSPSFSIVYTGTVYEDKQNPSPLFEAIQLLLGKNLIEADKFELHFYGASTHYLRKLLAGKGIDALLHLHDTISFEECVHRQKAANVLLFLNWNDLREKGLYSGKIFEYLATRRPILAFPRNPGSVVDQLLEQTKAGILCDSPEEIAALLKEWYDTFYSVGKLSYNGIDEEIQKYSRRNQARQFADIFEKATS